MPKRKATEVKSPSKTEVKKTTVARGVKKAKVSSPEKSPVPKKVMKKAAVKAVKEMKKTATKTKPVPVEKKKNKPEPVEKKKNKPEPAEKKNKPEPAEKKNKPEPAEKKNSKPKSKAVEEEAPSAKPKRGAKKSSPQESASSTKVKPSKPKASPVKQKKITKAVSAPKSTNQAKETKTKKAASAPVKEPESTSSGLQKKKAVPVAQNRKRTKVVKEEVSVKKPRVEIVIPFRHQRGIGAVLATGQGDVGQLGLGPDVLEKSRPALVDKVKDIVDVVAGGMHTVCLTSKGQVYTFGCNDEGALGRETTEEGSEFEPGMVELPGKVVLVSAGDSHSAALLEDGRVFIWGTFRDSHGTMGLTSTGSKKYPVPILEDVPMKRIASGADHFVCLSVDGQVYTCGCAEQGQLGRVAEVFSNRGGRKGKDYLLTPQMVALGKKNKKMIILDEIWTGSYCTFVRAQETGFIYVFGLNNYNQLGLPSQDTRFQPEISDAFKGRKWQSISCGQHHALALDDNGKVYSLGRKEYGRLGMGAECTDLAEPTPIPTLNSEKVVEVAAGEAVSLAVTESGLAYSWGMGTNGQLGNGSEDDLLEPAVIKSKQLENRRVIAISAGGQHTVVLAVNKTAEPVPSTKPN